MSRLLLIGLLLCSIIADTHALVLHNYCNDTSGLRLLGPADTITVESIIETKNEPVTAEYLLKNTRWGDTLAAFQSTYRAVMPVPFELFLPLETTPEFPFPHPNATPFKDSIYPLKIVPSKKDQRFLGITTFDLALISRHVLGIQPFTSPYKMIAADVNKDGTVDGTDILHLRRLILHIDSAFRLSPHWIFIPKTYPMPDIVPPIDSIPQAYYFNPYSPNLPHPFEFVTIKIGDVNNSYRDTVSAVPPLTQIRNRLSPFVLTTENRRLEKGKTYQLDLKCLKNEKFIALQGTLSLDSERGKTNTDSSFFDKVESETLTNFGEQNINKTAKNEVAFSWNMNSDKTFEANTTIFSIQFKANRDGFLSDILNINDAIAENLVYTEGGETCKMALKFTEPTKGGFSVSQNEPNPFDNETFVKIDIPSEKGEAAPTKWSLFDETGHLIYQKTETFKNGISVLRLNAQELGLSKTGFYFLKIETVSGTQTIKLVKM